MKKNKPLTWIVTLTTLLAVGSPACDEGNDESDSGESAGTSNTAGSRNSEGNGGTAGSAGASASASGAAGNSYEAYCDPSYFPGKECTNSGYSCGYSFDECGGGSTLTCTSDHVWENIEGPPCCLGLDPLPYPECPPTIPNDGEPCEVCIGALPCTYSTATDCGNQEVSAECDEKTQQWRIASEACD